MDSEGHTPLMRKKLEKDVTGVQNCIQWGADLEIQGRRGPTAAYDWGPTALMMAVGCQEPEVRIVRLLIEAQADPNAQDKLNEESPLFLAAIWGHPEAVRLLLSAGAAVNMQTREGKTALTAAIEEPPGSRVKRTVENGTEIVRLLMEGGANANTEDQRGESPLSLAVGYSDPPLTEIVRMLLHHGKDGIPSPQLAANPNALNREGRASLHSATHADIVYLLLEAGADPNVVCTTGGWQKIETTALSQAVEGNDPKRVRLLVDFGAENDLAKGFQGETPLDVAIEKGRSALVKIILEKQPDRLISHRSGGRRLLTQAVIDGDLESLELFSFLPSFQTAVNETDTTGGTPLLWAVESNQPTLLVDLLIRGGANMALTDANGKTALARAEEKGNKQLAERLRSAERMAGSGGGVSTVGGG
uniref:Uncharacterized protein n=1 Tax=Chromera velia CCMP2878 TaxID=1169474 RepID=A0A0G4GFY7_9ALVE|eukprot:Cvel_21659.t1-p1 / transcript=Cvel_21659.t1 / gene=Cvel_21659 / organism=Chromera_velia_CCMP2878 / gene_product=Ankyrin repeat and KH domain-containing protein, putative / transcript_product=Ankyrin repeat and KH domain-containing protein, putative / location=Cvel_scaffold2049:14742-15992(-) / protein_length=417 / sequence_SO=supercontig / SO=protein_coding / is_pseudo=false